MTPESQSSVRTTLSDNYRQEATLPQFRPVINNSYPDNHIFQDAQELRKAKADIITHRVGFYDDFKDIDKVVFPYCADTEYGVIKNLVDQSNNVCVALEQLRKERKTLEPAPNAKYINKVRNSNIKLLEGIVKELKSVCSEQKSFNKELIARLQDPRVVRIIQNYNTNHLKTEHSETLTVQIRPIMSNDTFVMSDREDILSLDYIGANFDAKNVPDGFEYKIDRNILPINHDFAAWTMLEEYGYKVIELYKEDTDRSPGFVTEEEKKELKSITTYEYSHFSMAELFRVNKLHPILEEAFKNDSLSFTRRLKTGRRSANSMTMGKVGIVHPDGTYETRIHKHRIIDTSAIFGVMSYDEMSNITSIDTPVKSLLKDLNLDMGQMHNNFLKYPLESLLYSVGDLRVYDVLNGANKLFVGAYKELDIPVKNPNGEVIKMTMGRNVAEIAMASIKKYMDVENYNRLFPNDKALCINWLLDIKEEKSKNGLSDKARDKYLSKINSEDEFYYKELENAFYDLLIASNSAQNLIENVMNTAALSAKVSGGRAINGKPTLTKAKYQSDGDMSGAYATCQKILEYGFGNPRRFGFELGREFKAPTVREFIELMIISYEEDYKRKKKDKSVQTPAKIKTRKTVRGNRKIFNYPCIIELIHSCSFTLHGVEQLKTSQDYFPSWFATDAKTTKLHKEVVRMLKANNESAGNYELDAKKWNTKVLTNEIHFSQLTLFGWDYLFNIAPDNLREEILDKCQILGGYYYLNQDKVESYQREDGVIVTDIAQTLHQIIIEDKFKDKAKNNLITGEIIIDDSRTYTFSAKTMGELLVNKVRQLRGGYQKKTPMNNVYKLIGNTTYGDLVSRWFNFSNIVYANAITSLCRHYIYMYEKSLNSVQSITDGAMYDLLNIFYKSKVKDNLDYQEVVVTDGFIYDGLRHKKGVVTGLLNLKSIEEVDNPIYKFIEDNGYEPNEYELENILLKSITHEDANPDELPKIAKSFKGYKYLPKFKVTFEDGSSEIWQGYSLKKVHHETGIEYKVRGNYLNIIDEATSNHVMSQFPNSIMQQYKNDIEIEVKELYTDVIFQAMTDYRADSPWLIEPFQRKRSHESRKQHYYPIDIDNDIYVERDTSINECFNLLENIDENGFVDIPTIFIKSKLLKLNDYMQDVVSGESKNHDGKYKSNGLIPSDNVLTFSMVNLFSMSTFTFKTRKQFFNWQRGISKMKEHLGWGVEALYYDESLNKINYEKMIRECYTRIKNGAEFFRFTPDEFDSLKPHPDFEMMKRLKAKNCNVVIDESDFIEPEDIVFED